jgi:geranylgeranyl reductase family protein
VTTYDVIVVGAGPAGALAAYELARAGCDVLVLDMKKFPRYKPCGGGVTTKALRLLDFSITEVVERQINAATISFWRKRNLMIDGRDVGLLVMRSGLDALIARKASGAGATVIDGNGVVDVVKEGHGFKATTHNGKVFRSRFVIGADGANSIVARAFAMHGGKEFGIAIETEIDAPREMVDNHRVLFDFGAVANGYAYEFPKARHLSVGVYTSLGKLPRLRETLRAYLAKLAAGENWVVRSEVGHLVPLGRDDGTVERSGAMLVGDAAGLGDPLWGEGIYYAMKSGQIAAEVAIDALWRNTGTSIYRDRLRMEVLKDLGLARLFARLFYRLPERVFVAVVAEHDLAEQMMGILRGDVTYRQYLSTVLKRLPQVTAQMMP